MKVYLQNRVHFLALTVHIENILPQVMFIDKFNEVFSQNLKNVGIVCVFFINDFFFFIFFSKAIFPFKYSQFSIFITLHLFGITH